MNSNQMERSNQNFKNTHFVTGNILNKDFPE